jgi:hypothetical protein
MGIHFLGHPVCTNKNKYDSTSFSINIIDCERGGVIPG